MRFSIASIIFVLLIFSPLALGIRVLEMDEDFFNQDPGLSGATSGGLSCERVSGNTIDAMSSKVGRKVRAHCRGELLLQYIPARKQFVPFNSRHNKKVGTTLVCCRVGAKQPRRRYRR